MKGKSVMEYINEKLDTLRKPKPATFNKYKEDFIVKTLLEKVTASTPKSETDAVEKQIEARLLHLEDLEKK